MIYTIFSDVHGNIGELERFFRVTSGKQNNGYFCLGDLTDGRGIYDENRCIDLARAHGTQLVIGNHDKETLLLAERSGDVRRRFSQENLDYLRGSPEKIQEGRWVLAHTLTGIRLTTPIDAIPEFGQIGEKDAAFLGHSHSRFKGFRKNGHGIEKQGTDRINVFDGAKYIVCAGALGGYLSEGTYLLFNTETGEVERTRI